jgi:hypothetical protein
MSHGIVIFSLKAEQIIKSQRFHTFFAEDFTVCLSDSRDDVKVYLDCKTTDELRKLAEGFLNTADEIDRLINEQRNEDNYMSMKAIWNEADELCQDFDGLSDADIVDLRDTMQERCERIRQLAGVNLTDEDVE